ncbi:hypothetical protein [Scopulibacillus cellulosilyticus]|uniref:Spore coat protein B n=1 Tax=Scopulibacillus cellulosilyticus TaxID=2665665 RepID=A0ABW2Q1I7_9BACL
MFNQSSIEMISKLIGNNVKINMGGPESKTGELLTVSSDHLAIDSEKDGVIYYQLRHVRGVTVNSKNASLSSGNANYIEGESFNDILSALTYKKIRINRGGPESVEGVLNRAFDHYIEVTTNDEVLFVSIYHIKSISHVSDQKKDSGSSGQSNGRSNRRSRNNSSQNEVMDAVEIAKTAGTELYMYNEPWETSCEPGTSSKRTRTSRNRRRSHRSGSMGGQTGPTIFTRSNQIPRPVHPSASMGYSKVSRSS